MTGAKGSSYQFLRKAHCLMTVIMGGVSLFYPYLVQSSYVIVKRLSLAVNEVLRQEQAGFRKGRGCTEHIFSLRNIIEQCHEWQRGLYINFIDFQKAFDSVHRESLWSIPRAYGIPAHIVQVIKQFHTDFCCSVGGSDLSFHVKSGVRQGCVMSALVINIVIDWVLSQATEDRRRGIRWTLSTVLEDLDYADDTALLSHSFSHMQEKTDRLKDSLGR